MLRKHTAVSTGVVRSRHHTGRQAMKFQAKRLITLRSAATGRSITVARGNCDRASGTSSDFTHRIRFSSPHSRASSRKAPLASTKSPIPSGLRINTRTTRAANRLLRPLLKPHLHES